jgi:3-methyladenine DNA glycosylase AlkD
MKKRTREVLTELEELGTAQNRKVYGRHGVTGELYGVSYAHLERLEKRYRGEHELALELWESGIHDARILASQIADAEALTAKVLDAWLRAVDNHVLGDAVAQAAARSPKGPRCAKRWRARKGEWAAATGWNLYGRLVPELDSSEHQETLVEIEERIRESPNRVRHAMNGALIAIGSEGDTLQRAAIAVAKRIGVVEVDHGETGCKTPSAIPYIKKTVAHRQYQDAMRRKRAADKARAARKKKAAKKKAAKKA